MAVGNVLLCPVTGNTHNVGLSTRVACLQNFSANAVLLKLKLASTDDGVPLRPHRPFAQWREVFNRHPTSLPALKTHDRTGQTIDTIGNKSKLYNKIIQYLEEVELGWDASVAESTGKTFCSDLTEVLWGISTWHVKLHERATEPYTQVLVEWDLLKDSRNQNNLAAKRHGAESCVMTQDGLYDQEKRLWAMAERSYMHHKKWGKVHGYIVALARLLEENRQWLHQQNMRQQKVHEDEEHSRHCHVPNLHDHLVHRKKANGATATQYRELEIEVAKTDYYTPIQLTDKFAPHGRKERYHWYANLEINTAVTLFCYHQGGSRPTIHWLFTVDYEQDNADAVREKLLRIADDLRNSIDDISSRAERKAYVERFSLFTELTKPLRKALFEHLTGTKATKQHMQRNEFDDRMNAILLLDDHEMIADLRNEMHGDPKTSLYDKFWEEVGKLMEEKAVLVAEENRKDQLSRTAIDISYASLQRAVVDRVPNGTPIPSYRWFLYQFFPTNMESREALHHTGRFAVKLKAQSRSMRKASVDAPYGLQAWRMFKDMAVLLGAFACVCVCCCCCARVIFACCLLARSLARLLACSLTLVHMCRRARAHGVPR